MWQTWLSGLIGIWLIVSPWVYDVADNTGVLWNSIIFGAVLLILAVWSGIDAKSKSKA